MLPSTAQYKQVIHAPHSLAFEVDLYAGPGGVLLESGVPIFGGSISANLTQRVTRSGTFTLGPEFWPTLATDPLTPYQTVANIKAGIRYGNGATELFDVITGRVGELTRNDNGSVTARIDDLAADVVAYQFETPVSSESPTVVAQIKRIIEAALPAATFGTNDVIDAAMPDLTWDEDRGKALDDLAESLGARWYTLGNGDFVVRRLPYDVGTPVQDIFDGIEGLLISGTPTLTRDGAANSVTVIVERFDGGAPFRVRARDNAVGSPTLFNGPFGKVTEIIKVQTPLSMDDAKDYATAQLKALTALSSTWGVSCVPDYTLEPGDTVRLESRGVRETQLIDSITYPLSNDLMTLGTRARTRANSTFL